MGSVPLSLHQPPHFLKSESYILEDFCLHDARRSFVASSDIWLCWYLCLRQPTRLVGALPLAGSLGVWAGSDPPSGGSVVVFPLASPEVLDTIPGPSTLELPVQALPVAVVFVSVPSR